MYIYIYACIYMKIYIYIHTHAKFSTVNTKCTLSLPDIRIARTNSNFLKLRICIYENHVILPLIHIISPSTQKH